MLITKGTVSDVTVSISSYRILRILSQLPANSNQKVILLPDIWDKADRICQQSAGGINHIH